MMERDCAYSLAKQSDGAFRLNRTTESIPGAAVFIKPVIGRTGETCGWRLKPLITMQGAKSKIWGAPAAAIASTKLLRLAAAKRAVEQAGSDTS